MRQKATASARQTNDCVHAQTSIVLENIERDAVTNG